MFSLIAATCKHHGINKIATFDFDFERVERDYEVDIIEERMPEISRVKIKWTEKPQKIRK